MDGLHLLSRKASTPCRPYPTLFRPYMSHSGRFQGYPKTCIFYVLQKVILTYPFRDHFLWVWSPGDHGFFAMIAVAKSTEEYPVQRAYSYTQIRHAQIRLQAAHHASGQDALPQSRIPVLLFRLGSCLGCFHAGLQKVNTFFAHNGFAERPFGAFWGGIWTILILRIQCK